MKKEHRDEIKQDELASGLEKAAGLDGRAPGRDPHRGGSARRAPRRGRGGRLLPGPAGEGGRSRLPRRPHDLRGAGRLEIAARCRAALRQVFATAEEKYKTAAAAFEGVERRFGSSKTGLRAKYYAALSRVQLGQNAEAEKALKEIQALGGGLEPELARLALADLYRRSQQVDKAVEAYRGMATNPTANVPRDYALLRAAQALEDAKRWPEARAAYRQVFEEFPASVFATEARARVEYLQTQG